MKALIALVFLFYTSPIHARYEAGTGYVSASLNSDSVSAFSYNGLSMFGGFIVPQSVIPQMSLVSGGSYYTGTMSWGSQNFERAGYFSEFSLDVYGEFFAKQFSALAGMRIPVYSKYTVGGIVSTATKQGYLESNSLATYKGSGFELYGSGSYPVGNLKVFSLSALAMLQVELAYVMKTLSLVETSVESSFGDFSGTPTLDIAANGVAIKVGVNLKLK